MTQIYLDSNATSYLDPRVSERMAGLERQGVANPASQHHAGRQSIRALEAAKSMILRSIGAADQGMNAAQIILTSGGTEANNLALHAFTYQREGLVIVGAMEHPSILQAAELSAICLNLACSARRAVRYGAIGRLDQGHLRRPRFPSTRGTGQFDVGQ